MVSEIRVRTSSAIFTPSSSTTKCSEPMTARLPSRELAMPCATRYSTSA